MDFNVVKIKNITSKKDSKHYTKVLLESIDHTTNDTVYISAFLPGDFSEAEIESFVLRTNGAFKFYLLSDANVYDAELFI